MIDVITLGETMLRLTPPDFERLEQAHTLQVHVGGSESNVAVGLARLGLRAVWLSRLTSTPHGQMIASALRGQGVDVSRVIWTDQDRTGLYFFEEGRAPRDSRVFYDREGSAFSRIQPEDLPADLFAPNHARLLHLTGITPALSSTAAATARAALDKAQAAGWRVSFDLNYRATLWKVEAAREGCAPFLQAADLIFIAQRDMQLFYGTLEALRRLNPRALIVVTLGAEGAMASSPTGETWQQSAFPVEAVSRIGGGDAFVAGFLYGYLNDSDLPRALRWGAAAAALKYSLPGDMPLIERAEAQRMVDNAHIHNGLIR